MFYLEMDPSGISQYVILWNGSENYWSSGIWNGQTFTRVPELRPTDAYSFEYVSNTTENYFTYTVHSTGLISRLVMDYNGQIKSLAWVPASNGWMLFWSKPKEQCQVYKGCGAFGRCNDKNSQHCGCLEGFSEASFEDWNLGDHSGGCVRKTPLQCSGNSSAGTKMDRFYQMDGVKLPANPRSVQAGSIDECETACLSNCSCTAYSYSSGCSLWLEDLLNIQEQYDEAAATLFLRLAASELPTSQSKKGSSIRGVIGGIGGFIVLLSIAWFISWRLQRKRIISAAKTVSDGNLAAFRYGDLQRVTKNFSDKLGSGGFGSVYKGALPDSKLIAVKKLQDLIQRDKQFRTEVSTIGKIQHINLIRLHGFCADGNNKCLVYEFMPNSSLDAHLFHSSKTDLDWSRRYQIMLGIARGLAYLHEKCRDCIIHCDIKPENILLDDSFIPKVADFGLAKLLGRDLSRVLTTMRGTRGYLAPEWISGIAVTAKADVYSYGMMLFEIISGKRNTDHWEDDKPGFFPASAVKNLMNGNVLSILDPRLEGKADVDEVIRTCKIACWCIQDEEMNRPTMGQVVQILEGITEISMPPVPKSIQLYSGQQQQVVFFSDFSVDQSKTTQSTFYSSSQNESSNSTTSKELLGTAYTQVLGTEHCNHSRHHRSKIRAFLNT
ncbi:hypothetical protein HPP92_011998 [Vanilla planifolia]|uniref:non-specific serine/threonine protein kinase n=1 Tax=Vanilla planifolia TaxID=51239 RepID=A0A835R807_VANPL|nr:hypothetical protein HPP92_011998 [Vanilla planifolia]